MRQKLLTLVCYISSTIRVNLIRHTGDTIGACRLLLFTDSSFALHFRSSKSTTGLFLAWVGPSYFAALAAISTWQTAVSHSSAEAAIIAMEHALRVEGLLVLDFWDTVMPWCARGRPTRRYRSLISPRPQPREDVYNITNDKKNDTQNGVGGYPCKGAGGDSSPQEAKKNDLNMNLAICEERGHHQDCAERTSYFAAPCLQNTRSEPRLVVCRRPERRQCRHQVRQHEATVRRYLRLRKRRDLDYIALRHCAVLHGQAAHFEERLQAHVLHSFEKTGSKCDRDGAKW